MSHVIANLWPLEVPVKKTEASEPPYLSSYSLILDLSHIFSHRKDAKKPTLSYSINLDAAKTIAQGAPAGSTNQSKGEGTTGSEYPHTFQNFDGFEWPRAECNIDPKTKRTKVETVEFPIYAGKDITHQFPWTQKKDVVPDCRVVHARVGGAFCGVMCHKYKDAEMPGKKGFTMCK